MKTEQDLKEKIAKHAKEPVERVNIEDNEIRENCEGKRLADGQPVYVTMNTGVEGEEVPEFYGWIINGKWYKQ